MCIVTATEFKNNLGKYIELGAKEDILITKNGKPLVKLVSANGDALSNFFQLSGLLKDQENDFDEILMERHK